MPGNLWVSYIASLNRVVPSVVSSRILIPIAAASTTSTWYGIPTRMWSCAHQTRFSRSASPRLTAAWSALFCESRTHLVAERGKAVLDVEVVLPEHVAELPSLKRDRMIWLLPWFLGLRSERSGFRPLLFKALRLDVDASSAPFKFSSSAPFKLPLIFHPLHRFHLFNRCSRFRFCRRHFRFHRRVFGLFLLLVTVQACNGSTLLCSPPSASQSSQSRKGQALATS